MSSKTNMMARDHVQMSDATLEELKNIVRNESRADAELLIRLEVLIQAAENMHVYLQGRRIAIEDVPDGIYIVFSEAIRIAKGTQV